MGLFIDPNATVPYVPKAERDKAKAGKPHVVATLRVLTAARYAAVQNLSISNLGLDVRRGTHILELVRFGLAGMHGPDVPTWQEGEDGCPTDEYLTRLSGALRVELADKLDEMNTVGLHEGKAFGSSSHTPTG